MKQSQFVQALPTANSPSSLFTANEIITTHKGTQPRLYPSLFSGVSCWDSSFQFSFSILASSTSLAFLLHQPTHTWKRPPNLNLNQSHSTSTSPHHKASHLYCFTNLQYHPIHSQHLYTHSLSTRPFHSYKHSNISSSSSSRDSSRIRCVAHNNQQNYSHNTESQALDDHMDLNSKDDCDIDLDSSFIASVATPPRMASRELIQKALKRPKPISSTEKLKAQNFISSQPSFNSSLNYNRNINDDDDTTAITPTATSTNSSSSNNNNNNSNNYNILNNRATLDQLLAAAAPNPNFNNSYLGAVELDESDLDDDDDDHSQHGDETADEDDNNDDDDDDDDLSTDLPNMHQTNTKGHMPHKSNINHNVHGDVDDDDYDEDGGDHDQNDDIDDDDLEDLRSWFYEDVEQELRRKELEKERLDELKMILKLKDDLGQDFARIFDPKNPFIGESL